MDIIFCAISENNVAENEVKTDQLAQDYIYMSIKEVLGPDDSNLVQCFCFSEVPSWIHHIEKHRTRRTNMSYDLNIK